MRMCLGCYPHSRKTIEGNKVVVNNPRIVVLTLYSYAVLLISDNGKIGFYGGTTPEFFVTFSQDAVLFVFLNSVFENQGKCTVNFNSHRIFLDYISGNFCLDSNAYLDTSLALTNGVLVHQATVVLTHQMNSNAALFNYCAHDSTGLTSHRPNYDSSLIALWNMAIF